MSEVKINYSKHKNLILFSIILSTFFLFVYHFSEIGFFAYAGLAFMLLPVLFVDLSECMCLILFYLPNIRMYAFIDGNTMLGFFVLFAFVKFFFLRFNKISIKIFLAVIFMGAVVIINAFLNQDFSLFMSFIRFSAGLIIILMYFNLVNNEYDFDFDYEKLMKYFIYGCFSLITCGILFESLKGHSVFNQRFSGINNDPNFFAMVVGAAFSIQLVNIAFSKKASNGSLFIALYILFGGMLSLSRSFLISISINIILLLYIFFVNRSLSMNRKILIILLIPIFLFIFRGAISNIYESFVDRFNEGNLEGANGRAEINEMYLKLWRQNAASIWFGIGSYEHIVSQNLFFDAHHNYYVEILTTIGIFGVLAMINIYRLLYKNIIIKIQKLNILLLFPLLTYAIMIMTLPALFDDTHLFMIMLMMMQYRRFQDHQRGVLT